MKLVRPLALVAACLIPGVVACSSDDTTAGSPGSPGSPTDVTDPGKGGFVVTVSGEDLAAVGYDWTSSALASGDPPAFVDGWAVNFEHVIITVDKIRVNADPDKNEGNPEDMGGVVATADGPWAVDATLGGNLVGKSGSPDEKTVAITSIASQSNGASFDPTARYAFSYDLVQASSAAKMVNLDAEGQALYEQAKARGWSMIFAGKATYRGPAPDASSVFSKIPTEVKFTLGLHNPSSYVNCRNTDLQQVGGEFPRGVQASANGPTTVQITIHTDHAFWDKLNVEGTPLHFDPIAANASADGTVTIDDLANVDVTGFTTRSGEPLPWRSLVSDYTAPNGQMRFDANGTSFAKANSYASYLAYSAASGGHMNADGECVVKNAFAP